VFVDVDRLVAGDGDELDALRHRLALGGGPPSSALLRDVVQSAAFATTYPPLPDSSVGIAAWRRLLAFAAAHRSPLARHGAS
jgi:hypothetical protein